jgi:hypothetical protein
MNTRLIRFDRLMRHWRKMKFKSTVKTDPRNNLGRYLGYSRSSLICLLVTILIGTTPGTVRASTHLFPATSPAPIFESAVSFTDVHTPDPMIQNMIDQVDSNTIRQYTGDLSGEWPVQIDGQEYTIRTRYTYSSEPIRKATKYVGDHFVDLGLEVDYHTWEGQDYPNVVGQLTGQTDPEDIFMITGHLDSIPSGSVAPGADDNASGSTATLVAADILSQFEWGCTLRFAVWTGEEQGLLGSDAYAARARTHGENILGVLNLDMIAYNSDTQPTVNLFANSSVPGSTEISILFQDVVQVYDINLDPELYVDNSLGNRSDNKSFWDEGYPAILAIEDYYGDFNPYYHSTSDTLANIDLSYYTQFVKASVGTFAHMAGCLIANPQEPTFVDVPFDHWAHDYIEALYQAGYTAGCSTDPLMYCPERTLNRAEGAVFTVRAAHGAQFAPPQPTEQVFADTLLTDWPVDWITQLWDDGYTAGCGTDPLIFCPWQDYNRAEGAVFALRMKYGIDYVPPQPNGVFSDVSTEDWFIEWVEAAYSEGSTRSRHDGLHDGTGQGIEPAIITHPFFQHCTDIPGINVKMRLNNAHQNSLIE